MNIPRLLIDNDVFILLAASDLLDEVAEFIGVETTQLTHLGTLPYVLDSRKHRNRFPATVVAKIAQKSKQIQILQDRPDATLMQTLQAARNIDEGEAILYAHLAQTSAYFRYIQLKGYVIASLIFKAMFCQILLILPKERRK